MAAHITARTHFLNTYLVHDDIFDAFATSLVEDVEALVVGDPSEETTDVGPMISLKAAERAEAEIAEAIRDGASLLCGGARDGQFVTPTVLARPSADSSLTCREAFAPVAVLIPYRTLGEAIEVTNSTEYGLQAGVFTSNVNVAMAVATRLDVGGVIVNDASSYRVDSMPYGGVKQSGTGREGVRYAMEEMTDPRLVVLNLQEPAGEGLL